MSCLCVDPACTDVPLAYCVEEPDTFSSSSDQEIQYLLNTAVWCRTTAKTEQNDKAKQKNRQGGVKMNVLRLFRGRRGAIALGAGIPRVAGSVVPFFSLCRSVPSW